MLTEPELAAPLGVIEPIVGPVATVNVGGPVTVPPSGFVTVTVRAPGVAPDAIEITTVTCVGESRWTEPTVMPAPPNTTAGVGAKFVPVMINESPDAPWPPDEGETFETVGETLTVKHWAQVDLPWSGLVTVTSRAEAVAPDAIETSTVG